MTDDKILEALATISGVLINVETRLDELLDHARQTAELEEEMRPLLDQARKIKNFQQKFGGRK